MQVVALPLQVAQLESQTAQVLVVASAKVPAGHNDATTHLPALGPDEARKVVPVQLEQATDDEHV